MGQHGVKDNFLNGILFGLLLIILWWALSGVTEGVKGWLG